MTFDQWLDTGLKAAPLLAIIIVPVLTYKFALQAEHRRWIRERRSGCYEDWIMFLDAWMFNTKFKSTQQERVEIMAAGIRMLPKFMLFTSSLGFRLVRDWLDQARDVDPDSPEFDELTREHARNFMTCVRLEFGLERHRTLRAAATLWLVKTSTKYDVR